MDVNKRLQRVIKDLDKIKQEVNKKLIAVRETFDEYNLISGIHSFMSINDKKYEKLLPPLVKLSTEKQKELLLKLKNLDFIPAKNIAA